MGNYISIYIWGAGTRVGTRTTCGISVHHTWVLDIKLKLSGLATEIYFLSYLHGLCYSHCKARHWLSRLLPPLLPPISVGCGPAGPTGFAHSLEHGRVYTITSLASGIAMASDGFIAINSVLVAIHSEALGSQPGW